MSLWQTTSKLLGVTDNHLNFDRHISNVCSSSYFHIRALRHIRPDLDSGTFKTIACAIVGSRLHYANSVLTGISARNIHTFSAFKIPWREASYTRRVVTRSTTNSTSALNSLQWLPFGNELIINWLPLFTILSKMFADDIKIWRKTRKLEDSSSLREDLDRLTEWSRKWLLHFNPEKCKVMHIAHDVKTVYGIDWLNRHLQKPNVRRI